MNDLANVSSPYLRQHAADPVDWRTWTRESFAEARQRNVPIFLSVGYAACHWCHVMQHEVFQNPEIAGAMNKQFVNIKVDREERPDIDEAYMLATQLLTGSGGWPMSVWLTHDLKPFYAGTYFPPHDAHGRPGFSRLTTAISIAWSTKRSQLEEQADEIWAAMLQAIKRSEVSGKTGQADLLRLFLDAAEERFDFQYGGFRGSPKFPPHQALQLWLQIVELQRTKSNKPPDGIPDDTTDQFDPTWAQWRSRAEQMLTITLDNMQWGGIHDLAGGGFARYSTDACWRVPHFEKMLYDNAQLAEIYARAALCLQRPDYAYTAGQILNFWLQHMSSPDGLFYSSVDADSEGEEGKYYTWSWSQLSEVLASDPSLFDYAARVLNISRAGNWDGTNVLELSPSARETPSLWFDSRWGALISRLQAARQTRLTPQVDYKIITAWNGLMLSAMAQAARLENGHPYRAAGARFLSALRDRLLDSTGRLLRSICSASCSGPGFLDDYAYLIRGLIDWARINPDHAADTMALAGQLMNKALDQFSGDEGSLYSSADFHESPLRRMRADFDNAVPSPSAVLIAAMLDIDEWRHSTSYVRQAEKAIGALYPFALQQPLASATFIAALLRHARRAKIIPQVEWRLTAVRDLADGGRQLEVHARLPDGYHFQQPPEFYLVANAEDKKTQSSELKYEVFDSSKKQLDQTGAGIHHFILKISAGPGTYQKRVTIRYTLCNDHMCLPERHDSFDVAAARDPAPKH